MKYTIGYLQFGSAPKKDVEKIRKIPGVVITGELQPEFRLCEFRATFQSEERLTLNDLRLGGHWFLASLYDTKNH